MQEIDWSWLGTKLALMHFLQKKSTWHSFFEWKGLVPLRSRCFARKPVTLVFTYEPERPQYRQILTSSLSSSSSLSWCRNYEHFNVLNFVSPSFFFGWNLSGQETNQMTALIVQSQTSEARVRLPPTFYTAAVRSDPCAAAAAAAAGAADVCARSCAPAPGPGRRPPRPRSRFSSRWRCRWRREKWGPTQKGEPEERVFEENCLERDWEGGARERERESVCVWVGSECGKMSESKSEREREREREWVRQLAPNGNGDIRWAIKLGWLRWSISLWVVVEKRLSCTCQAIHWLKLSSH